MRVSSLVCGELTVQDAEARDSGAVRLSTSSLAQSDDNATVLVALSVEDMNALKQTRGLATSANDTFLVMTEAAIRDTNNNTVQAIVDGQALPVTRYTRDSTPPRLLEFDLDMNTGLLTLSFSEIMNIDSL